MRKLAVALFAVAACGGNNAKPDAAIIKIVDAAIDARPDAPPPPPPVDARIYDFSCEGMPLPATAADPVTLSGDAEEIMIPGGISPVVGASIASYKTGTASALNTVLSGAAGAYMTGNLVTGGVPLDGYVEATGPAGVAADGGSAPSEYRASFIYPASPIVANLTGVPIIMVKESTFMQLGSFAGATQDDSTNGALILQVVDCSNTPIAGATITAKQGATNVGTTFDLGQFSSQAAGTFFVFNVPAGATDVGATYMTHTLRTHTVMAYKADATTLPNGALTLTIIKPGP